jgi:hypothetical protein
VAHFGRKPKLDDAAKQKVYEVLTLGASLQDAADILGVDRSTLTRAKQSDPTFAHGIKKATAEGKVWHLQQVKDHKPGAWQASAWMLERKWYKEFARRDPPPKKVNEADLLTPDPNLPSAAIPPGAVPAPPAPPVPPAEPA